MDFLSEDKQYDKILNNEEISKIRDFTLREIRARYWRKQTDAFMDEHNIPDHMLGEYSDRIRAEEKRELEEYRRQRGITEPLNW
ncbi:hypothetical protein [Selenomonas noxia]|uniref:hypothetical protein n=1 Tax=Selenomonas noxia TaxID=135083 RepID=UPI00288083E4|nr:hypothetical protein [Selenomonas noxia]